jgi:eukaryotic-like serine/threonine-protein kinase
MKLAEAEEIFNQALEMATPEERSAFLKKACGPNDALREKVERLLVAHEGLPEFLAATPGTVTLRLPLTETPGSRIGRYKLLEKIGEGGMGVVYMAEQEEPVRRRVALKIIKLGMDTKSVIARFEAERQALALMDHPNIAKVLDGGATDTGRPFFVMELVQGVPITEFCDKNHLPVAERINLFIIVCQAIQSAHQKGIIHRDLKPTNILVTLNGGVPEPMVIDFGVAKATNQKLTEKTVFTNYATMIGTPAYMSPEQAEMSRLDVDTRSDIYGLGVLLYELLTGTTPFPEKRLRSATYQEMQRIIMEEEPERPSTRLRQKPIGASPSCLISGHSLAAKASAAAAALSTDLDWIVMKCLEKDRARRYETASGLAADLNRHLENEPVVARPPSNLYRFQKMVRRNKVVVAAAAMVALALLVGAGLASWQAVRASRERDAKETALRQAVAAQQEQTRLREKAQTAERDEVRLREQAQAQAYASDMLLAQQSIFANNFGRARELLYRHRPQSRSDKDLRGWEWRYLWQQCASDALAKVWQATNMITDLAVSPDEKWLAVGQSSDVTAVTILQFVDRTTARIVTNLPARRGTEVSLAFSPKAPLLAFNSSENAGTSVQWTLHLWNVETRQTLFELPLRYFCTGLAFSPDGSTLLVAVQNQPGRLSGELLLYQVPSGTLRRKYDVSIPATPGWSPDVTVDPDFQFAAVGGQRLQVIDLSTGKPRWSAANKQGEFESYAFAREGKILITAEGLTDSLLRVWDVNSGKPIGQPVPMPHGMVNRLALWPNGKTLASATADGTIQIWDVSDPTDLRPLGRPLRGQAGEVNALALNTEDRTLLSGHTDGSVYAWAAEPRRPEPSPVVLTGVYDWQFAPDSRSILTIDPQGSVTRREGPDFQLKRPLQEIGADLARFRDETEFSDDGEFLATSRDGVVRVWDLQTRARAPRLVTPGRLAAHGFAPDGKLLIIYDPASSSVEEWDLNTLQKLASWPLLFSSRLEKLLITLSSHGKYLLNVSFNGDEISLRDLATGRVATWKNPGQSVVWDVNFCPDGTLFALSNMRGSAQVWDSASRQPVTTVGQQQLPMWAAGFSADGSRLITASDGSEAVTLWDLGSSRELLRLRTAGYRFESPRFSADGRLLGCGNWEDELYIWRAPSWAEIETTEKTVPDPQSTNMQNGKL